MVSHQRLLQILSKASDVLMMVSLLLVHKKVADADATGSTRLCILAHLQAAEGIDRSKRPLTKRLGGKKLMVITCSKRT
jgi:hypothetical protein